MAETIDQDKDLLEQLAELRRQQEKEKASMQETGMDWGMLLGGALGGLADQQSASGGGSSNYAKAAVDASQAANKNARELRLKALESSSEQIKALNELAKSRATDRKTMGLYGQQEKLENIRQGGLNERARLDREAGKYSAGAQRSVEKAESKAEKAQKQELELAVPGYERSGDVLPAQAEVQKFRQASVDSSQLLNKLKRMQDLVTQYGSFEFGGPGGTEMESLATEINLLSKRPAMFDLGVLAGPDLTLLQKITADPSSFSSLFTRDPSRQTQLTTQINSIKDKLAASGQALGYSKLAEKQQQQQVPTDDGPSLFDAPTANAAAPVGHPDPAKEARRQQLLMKAQGR